MLSTGSLPGSSLETAWIAAWDKTRPGRTADGADAGGWSDVALLSHPTPAWQVKTAIPLAPWLLLVPEAASRHQGSLALWLLLVPEAASHHQGSLLHPKPPLCALQVCMGHSHLAGLLHPSCTDWDVRGLGCSLSPASRPTASCIIAPPLGAARPSPRRPRPQPNLPAPQTATPRNARGAPGVLRSRRRHRRRHRRLGAAAPFVSPHPPLPAGSSAQ
mmetsp:Transcript_37074/g.109303  ORF Transcript_37074/g.109303 Transcript_37074/m.109303 type:complete len:217 (-) Transcript_37074:1337-1987(-)|eukprot:361711-Chlamydomonas_euryale.AAC.2